MMDKWRLSCLKMTRHCIGVERLIMNILLQNKVILSFKDGMHRWLPHKTPRPQNSWRHFNRASCHLIHRIRDLPSCLLYSNLRSMYSFTNISPHNICCRHVKYIPAARKGLKTHRWVCLGNAHWMGKGSSVFQLWQCKQCWCAGNLAGLTFRDSPYRGWGCRSSDN